MIKCHTFILLWVIDYLQSLTYTVLPSLNVWNYINATQQLQIIHSFPKTGRGSCKGKHKSLSLPYYKFVAGLGTPSKKKGNFYTKGISESKQCLKPTHQQLGFLQGLPLPYIEQSVAPLWRSHS